MAGGASGIFSTAQQFGGELGTAVVGTVSFGAVGEGLRGAPADAMPWVVGAFVACGVLCAALPRRAVPEHLG